MNSKDIWPLIGAELDWNYSFLKTAADDDG